MENLVSINWSLNEILNISSNIEVRPHLRNTRTRKICDDKVGWRINAANYFKDQRRRWSRLSIVIFLLTQIFYFICYLLLFYLCSLNYKVQGVPRNMTFNKQLFLVKQIFCFIIFYFEINFNITWLPYNIFIALWYQTTEHNNGRRHSKLFTNCHVSWDTL